MNKDFSASQSFISLAGFLLADVLSVVSASALIAVFVTGSAYGATLKTEIISSSEFKKVHLDHELTFVDSLSQMQSVPISTFVDGAAIDFSRQKNFHLFDEVIARMNPQFDCLIAGEGCLMMTYLDPSSLLISYNNQFGDQLAFQAYLNVEQKLAPAVRSHLYQETFEAENYFDTPNLADAGFVKVLALITEFQNGTLSQNDLRIEILKVPQAFAKLSDFYASLNQTTAQPLKTALNSIMPDALLMSLEALQHNGAGTTTYPFDDNLSPQESLLSVKKLYQALQKMGRWPRFAALDLTQRQQAGSAYLEKVSEDGSATDLTWKVKGSYNDSSNTIWLDYSLPFYENVYILEHELWHVLWNHTEYSKQSVQTILDLLKQPGASDSNISSLANLSNLRSQLLNLVSRNEFIAIDQQVRFYHSVGPYTDSWGKPAESTKNWHDSYLGPKVYLSLISKAQRESNGPIIQPGMGISSFNWHGFLVDTKMYRADFELGEKYFESQMSAHRKNFEEVYLGKSLSLNDDFFAIEKQILAELDAQTPVSLTCQQLSRLETALGSSWQFGIPFNYQLSDLQSCDGHPAGPQHPSNEGSHTEMDWVRGFPSLEGPTAVKSGSHR